MKKNQPEHVADILSRMVQSTVLGERLEQAKIWENWPHLIGSHLAKHCSPHSIKDGQLRVVVDGPVWMHKASYVKWDLLRRINLMAGRELVSDIFFLLDEEMENDESQKIERPRGRRKKRKS